MEVNRYPATDDDEKSNEFKEENVRVILMVTAIKKFILPFWKKSSGSQISGLEVSN